MSRVPYIVRISVYWRPAEPGIAPAADPDFFAHTCCFLLNQDPDSGLNFIRGGSGFITVNIQILYPVVQARSVATKNLDMSPNLQYR